MKTKKIWKVILFLSLVLLGSNLFNLTAQAQIKLTYANFVPATTFPCVQMERWAKEMEKRTNGKVKVQTFPGATLLSAKNMFDGVISGQADIGTLAMSSQPGRFPVSEAIDLPLGFSNTKASSLALYDFIEKYNPKEFEKVKIITLYTCAPANFMTTKPVRTLKDLKGLEIRVAGTGADIVQRLGGIPVAMPQGETPEALQRGVVKGMLSSMETLLDFNYAAYCPYATEVNVFVVTFSAIMNKEKWDSLPADVKKVIDDLRRDQALWTGTYEDDHVKESLEWSKKKYNHQLFQIPESEKKEIPKLLKPVIDEYIKRVTASGLPGEQMVRDAYSLKEKYEKLYK